MNRSRRNVLSAGGAALCAGLAGCSSLTDNTGSGGGKASIRIYNVHDHPATLSLRVEKHDAEDSGDPLLDTTVDLEAGGTHQFEHIMFFNRLFDITASADHSAQNQLTWKSNSNGLHILYVDLEGTPSIRFTEYADDED